MTTTFFEAFDCEHLHSTTLAPVSFDLDQTRICATVPCGKPTAIFSQLQGKLLSEYLSRHPKMTFYFEVTGDSMINAEIFSGDIIAVDCRLQPKDGNIVLAEINGELTLKRLKIIRHSASNGKGQPTEEMLLLPENPRHNVIRFSDFDDARIFGVASSKMRVDSLL